MNTIKYSIPLILIFMLVAGCAAPTEASSPAPINTSTPLSSATATFSATADAGTSFVPIIKIKLGFNDSIRVIPSNLDPNTQAAEIISQYQQVLSNQSEIWYGGTISGTHSFSFEVSTLSQDPGETVALQFPIHLILSRTNEPVDGVNIISPMGGGGGGEALVFQDFGLQAGEMDLVPDNSTPFALQVDNTPSVYFDFAASCQQAGVYKLEFSIPYTITDNAGTQLDASSFYIVSLVCAQTATHWLWDGENQMMQAGRWIFQNGQYVQQP